MYLVADFGSWKQPARFGRARNYTSLRVHSMHMESDLDQVLSICKPTALSSE